MQQMQDKTATVQMGQVSNLIVELASGRDDIEACQRLRHQVFAEEMGARLEGGSGLDSDHYDDYCHHLLVRDLSKQKVVACTRILTEDQARLAGGFYSQSEFDLGSLLPLPGRVMEIGRTCVHEDYRKGGAISVLWSGLAAFMSIHQFDFLMGCASISLDDRGATLNAIMPEIRSRHFSEWHQRVMPRIPVPFNSNVVAAMPKTPPLLKAYLRLGARVCGEPALDVDFNVADVFILLDVNDLSPRYQRHFLERQVGNHGISTSAYA